MHYSAFVLAFIAAALCLVAAATMNAPLHLQQTTGPVAEAKIELRQQCQMALDRYDLASAERLIRNTTLGREMAQDYQAKARPTLDHTLRTLNNHVFFGAGSMFAVLPFLALAAYQALTHKAEAAWASVAPAVHAVVACTVTAFCGYHFWLLDSQVSSCVLASGHWYTYAHTTHAFLLVLVHLLQQSEGEFTTPVAGYTAFGAIYQLLALQVLKSSQLYYHDDVESKAGIIGALYVLPLSSLVGCAARTAYMHSVGSARVVKEPVLVQKQHTASGGATEPAGKEDLTVGSNARDVEHAANLKRADPIIRLGADVVNEEHKRVAAEATNQRKEKAQQEQQLVTDFERQQRAQAKVRGEERAQAQTKLTSHGLSADSTLLVESALPGVRSTAGAVSGGVEVALQGKGGKGKGAKGKGKGTGKGAGKAGAPNTLQQQSTMPDPPIRSTVLHRDTTPVGEAPASHELTLQEQIQGFKKDKLKKQETRHGVVSATSPSAIVGPVATEGLLEQIRGFKKSKLKKGERTRQSGAKVEPPNLMSQLKDSITRRREAHCESEDDEW